MSLGKVGRIGLLAFLVAAIAAYFIVDLGAHLTLDSLKARQADLATLLDNRPLVIIGGSFVLYVATTALSLPGAAGGLVTAYIAAVVRAKVTLVEAGTIGGDCLNTGCVPSKALIRSARLAHDIRHASDFGLASIEPEVDFKAIMARIRSVIATIAPADSVDRYTEVGVDVRLGHAKIVEPWTVEITDREGGTQRLTTRSIVIAAGAEPAVPDIPGLAEAGFLTSDTTWDALKALDAVPGLLTIVGGGPIGTELAQAFARLGSAVTQIQTGPRLLPNEDEDVSAFIAETLRREGVDVRSGYETRAWAGQGSRHDPRLPDHGRGQ